MDDVAPSVRPARPPDREQVWPLAREFATSFRPRKEAFDRTFDALLAAQDTLFLVAAAQPRVVGYLLASRHRTFLANGPVAWVEEVMVDADARRSGIGTCLMQAAERWSVRNGCAYLALASRRAGPFYLALGYENSAVFYKKTFEEVRST